MCQPGLQGSSYVENGAVWRGNRDEPIYVSDCYGQYLWTGARGLEEGARAKVLALLAREEASAGEEVDVLEEVAVVLHQSGGEL